MADKTYSEAEVKALLARASGADASTRPYRVIKDAAGTIICYPPVGTPNAVAGKSGPWTINDEHPDDYYGVEEQDDDKGGKKYVATKGV